MFGTVKLVRKADGRPDLEGGTAYDQAAVRKWCLRFAPFLGFGRFRRRKQTPKSTTGTIRLQPRFPSGNLARCNVSLIVKLLAQLN